jgi:ABC-type glycerol-3-phosphate transport system substrate-binding protein
LERQVHNFFSSQRVPGRYLTLFYVITVSLALILALLAIYLYGENPGTVTASSTPMVIPQSTASIRAGTQEQIHNPPTPLPVIPSTPNVKTPSALGVTAAELNGVVVRLWHPWTGENESVLRSILDGFNQTNQWGITVEASAYEGFGRLDEAVESALLANTQPDVIIDYGYQARHWDGSNSLLDLTPYVNDPVWGLSADEQADYFPGFWAEDVFINGESGDSTRLGIPYYRSAYVMFYNQSWAHEMGYPNPPVTPEDFRVRACAAAQDVSSRSDKSDLGKGGWLITAQPGVLAGWLYAFGGNIADPDGGGYRLNTPESLKAFEYLKGLQASGCAWYDPGADAASEFVNRQALFIVGSLFDIPTQQGAFDQAGVQDEWVILPFPSSAQTVVDSYGPSLLIAPSTPARQLAAWLVVQWLTYPPNQAEWVEMLGTYPTRKSTLDYLTDQTYIYPQRSQALAILPLARGEPSLASWSVVRWVFEDVMRQLFDPQFTFDQIPVLLENMQSTATEIFVLVR